ncbi:hypothetical protein Vadar_020776 [Vaccinium darrowii]|uniref:Uncharacterized protein n=1 Tax=Vaccinium darrowii TaxID=229202 RepID=A0ACB7YPH9_9ERIC|nr:hypothetical protein Vadar_020776 [Vaccinium darrowii]
MGSHELPPLFSLSRFWPSIPARLNNPALLPVTAAGHNSGGRLRDLPVKPSSRSTGLDNGPLEEVRAGSYGTYGAQTLLFISFLVDEWARFLMEIVMVMFYWGGKIVEAEGEGLSYDIPPKGLFRVQCPISLSGLEAMLMPKVANNGEIGRLKFTCRYPHKNWRSDIKYVPLPINDDETLSNVLCMSSTFPSCLEIYVELEYTYGQEQMMLLGSSTFVEMLSQETLPRSGHLSMPFFDYSSQNQVVPPRHSHDIGGCSTATLGRDVLRTSNNAPNAEGPSLGGEFGCTEERERVF